MISSRGALRARWMLAWALLLGALGTALALARNPVLPRADFVFNNGGEISSLDPHTAAGVSEGRVARALFEPLLSKDESTRIVGGVAESWEASEDGLTTRFSLRPEARWSNGDPITAEDFAWSFRRILSPETAAENAYLLYCIDGAQQFHTGRNSEGEPTERNWGQVGVIVIDDHTLEIRLGRPTPDFLELMAFYAFSPVHRASIAAMRERFPSTWQREWMRPENLVCNGPFVVRERRINDRIRLVRNPLYWDVDNVAMRTIDVLAVERFGTALNMYLTGDIDWLDGTIPPQLIEELQDREDFMTTSYLGTYFYRINTTIPPYDDPLVRGALSLAVDRNAICSKILRAGQTPSTSFVPRGKLGTYRSPTVVRYDVEAAQARMARAGYWGPDSKPLPPIDIHFNESETHRDIAEYIAETWRRTFGLQVRLRSQERKIHLDRQKNLEYSISRSSWIADTARVGSFLGIWVTGGENNRTGWSNPAYDELIELAFNELGNKRRMAYFKEAERILLEESPMIPIYDYVSQNLVNPRLGGLRGNLLNEHFPKYWFWKNDAELKADRARLPAHKRGKEHEAKAQGPRQGLYSKAMLEARRGAGKPQGERQ